MNNKGVGRLLLIVLCCVAVLGEYRIIVVNILQVYPDGGIGKLVISVCSYSQFHTMILLIVYVVRGGYCDNSCIQRSNQRSNIGLSDISCYTCVVLISDCFHYRDMYNTIQIHFNFISFFHLYIQIGLNMLNKKTVDNS